MAADGSPGLNRSLGLFDASMLVMGGIVGAGIFMNPSVVANLVVKDPGSTLIGCALVCTGVPAYFLRKWWMARR